MDNTKKDTPIITAISTKTEILNSIQQETDPAKLDDALQLYNLAMKKSNLIRAAKLSDVQDNLVNELILRAEVASDLSTKELLEVYKVVQTSIDSATNTDVNTASVVINQQQINVSDGLNRENRKNITDAVNAILAKYTDIQSQETIIDVEVKEMKEE